MIPTVAEIDKREFCGRTQAIKIHRAMIAAESILGAEVYSLDPDVTSDRMRPPVYPKPTKYTGQSDGTMRRRAIRLLQQMGSP